MLKQEEKPLVLKPFVAAYLTRKDSANEKPGAEKHVQNRVEAARTVIDRIVQRVKRI